MGESACLMRSFSHPSDASRELREGDPVRALTESVSFGRFMSESLDWAKWSAFSHNRYLEEVEKFAKPGSVAAKKAYFEAHYRKKAALREASHTEEAGSGADAESPTAESESTELENHIKCDERQGGDCLGSDDVSLGTTDVESPSAESELTELESRIKCDERQEEDCSASVDVPLGTTDVESPSAESESTELENHIKCDERQEEDFSVPVGVSLGSKDVTLEENKPEDVEETSSGSVEQGPAIAQNDNSTQMRKSDECIETKTSESETKEGADPQTTIPSGVNKRLISVPKSSNQSKPPKPLLPRAKGIKPTEQRIEKDSGPRREKLADQKKKSAPKSIHMSISFTSSNVSTSKKLSPVLQQIRKLRDITASLKSQQDSSISRKVPTRASVCATSKVTPITAKLEERRMKTSLHKSVTGRLVTERSSNSLSEENSKSSCTNGSKGQFPIACSPFRFRSEERAAKRKEKQEEKANAMEAEKVKPREGYRLSTVKPRSPKLGKMAAQDTGPGTKPRPSYQTSANVETTAHTKGKKNAGVPAPVPSSRPRNKVRENSSPNIPQ